MHSLQMVEKAIDIARLSEGTSSWEGHLLYSASTSIAQRPVPKSLGPWQTSGGAGCLESCDTLRQDE